FLLYEINGKEERITLHTSISYLTSLFKNSNKNGNIAEDKTYLKRHRKNNEKIMKFIEVIGYDSKNRHIHSDVIKLPRKNFNLEKILRKEDIKLKKLIRLD
ncbi:hypothetical protein CL617_01935, partial [archaeon]|nr:hypothetical protein [archaeon]